MEIKHNILEFNKDTGSILVKYFCDEVPDGLIYNIDVPIENEQFVSEEVVLALVEAMTPRGQLERLVAMQTIEIPPYLAAKIPVLEVTPAEPAATI